MTRILLKDEQVSTTILNKKTFKQIYLTNTFDYILINNICFFNSYLEITNFDVYIQPANSDYFSARLGRNTIQTIELEYEGG